jgi:chemotaxis protein MotA
MNISPFLASIMLVGILYFGVFEFSAKPEIFLDTHAFLLVFGGTIVAALFSFRISNLFRLGLGFVKVLFLIEKSSSKKIVMNILEVASVARKGTEGLKGVRVTHPFIADGIEAITDKVIPETDFKLHLKNKLSIVNSGYQADAKVLQAIAKYPPAFGLLGAVTGMIGMMGELGGGVETIGMNMATALVATFWGIGLANFVLNPLADYYRRIADEDLRQRSIILEGMCLIKRKEPVVVIREKMLNFVPINERESIRKSFGSDGAGSSSRAA